MLTQNYSILLTFFSIVLAWLNQKSRCQDFLKKVKLAILPLRPRKNDWKAHLPIFGNNKVFDLLGNKWAEKFPFTYHKNL